MILIAGGEVRTDAAIVDIDARQRLAFPALEHARSAAPGKKRGIGLDVGDEIEHLLRRIRDQHGFVDQGHCYNAEASSEDFMSIVDNRKAYHDYFVEEKFEAGIALEGWEVKSIRGGRAQIKEAYVVV